MKSTKFAYLISKIAAFLFFGCLAVWAVNINQSWRESESFYGAGSVVPGVSQIETSLQQLNVQNRPTLQPRIDALERELDELYVQSGLTPAVREEMFQADALRISLFGAFAGLLSGVLWASFRYLGLRGEERESSET